MLHKLFKCNELVEQVFYCWHKVLAIHLNEFYGEGLIVPVVLGPRVHFSARTISHEVWGAELPVYPRGTESFNRW